MNRYLWFLLIPAIPFAGPICAQQGPYTEPGIAGYVDPVTRTPTGPKDLPPNQGGNPNAIVNPLLKSWPKTLDQVTDYSPADIDFFWSGSNPPSYPPNDPNQVLGLPTGSVYGVVCLGDQDQTEYAAGNPPGSITLRFPAPNPIQNGPGYDLAVYENGFLGAAPSPWWIVKGLMFAEFAYVEVSTDGITFIRFPSVSLLNSVVGAYEPVEISKAYNLAGKHPNADGLCFGTPFDLEDLTSHPKVLDGTVNLSAIHYVRIVDLPGNGHYPDNASQCINPATYPAWDYYPADKIIYDPWLTWGTGGFDLDAVCSLESQQYSADINLDGVVNLADLAILIAAKGTHFGQCGFLTRADLAEPKNLLIDSADVAAFHAQWLGTEAWRDKQP